MADSRCKYYKQKKQVSFDNGVTWYDVIPYEYQKGELYEMESQDCGYVPPVTEYRWVKTNDTTCVETPTPTEKKLVANYNGGRTNEVDCNSSTELTSGETKPSGYVASAMTSAVIGDCVTSIGGFAFAYCSGLTSITIPDSVTSIGIAAFQLCRSLTSITIPDSVTNIDNSAFMSCYSLRSIDIPSGVTSITEGLFFECSGLTSVTIGSSVTSIGKQAFEDCYNLTSVTIPDSVTSIAYAAFDDCRRLGSIDIPNSVTSIGSYAFIRCSGATSCVIGSGVTSIGEWAFAGCHSLTSVTCLATTPPSLGTSVFYETNCPIYVPCESVDLYKSATNWSNYADRIQGIPPCEEPPTPTEKKLVANYSDGVTREVECNTSSTLTFNEVQPLGYDYDKMTSAVIGDCVTSISSGAFRNFRISYFESLTSVTIPNSVTSIGSDAFNQCYKLTSITIPSSVTFIGYNAFAHCSGLTSITCLATTPPTINEGEYPFNYTNDCPIYVPCQSVAAYKSATGWSYGANRILGIPPCEPTIFKFRANYSDGRTYACECNDSTLLTSGETRNAIYSYSTMTSVAIGDCVATIGISAFDHCTSLTSCTIGNSVTSISKQAFYYCTSLTTCTIGNSVTSIGEAAFYGCQSLTSVTVEATTPPTLGRNAFEYTNGCPIYVPAQSLDAYKSASRWSSYASRIQPIT